MEDKESSTEEKLNIIPMTSIIMVQFHTLANKKFSSGRGYELSS